MDHLQRQWREAAAAQSDVERIPSGPALYYRDDQVIPVVVSSGKVEPFPLLNRPYMMRLVLVNFVDQIPTVDQTIEIGKPMSPNRWVDPRRIGPR
jgi:hypothetical protein